MEEAKTFSYRVLLETAEEGGYVVSVPALPGCLTQGETYEEAIEMAKDAIAGYLNSLIKHGDPIPVEEDHIETQVKVEVTPALV